MTSIVYVSLQAEDRIILFDRDSASGRLTERSSTTLAGGPAPMGLSPDRTRLYVGLRGEPGLAALEVGSNGDLTYLGQVPLETDPCYVAVDRSGHNVLSAYYGGGILTVHQVNAQGVPEREPADRHKTQRTSHMAMTDPGNRYVFLPHPDPNLILQFVFDAQSGKLSPNTPDRAERPEGSGPRHYCYHPNGRYVYFSGESGSVVIAYAFDPSTGVLSLLHSLSTLPETYGEKNTCAQIHITPDGRFLYVSNRGHDSLAIFEVDGTSGGLTARGWKETDPVPRAFNITADSRHVIVAGRDSGRVTVYAVDGRSGALTYVSDHPTGERALFVLTVELD